MRPEDQFHVGIVVDDLDTTRAQLTELFGYQWCGEIARPTPVTLPSGEFTLDLRFAYSRHQPRLEIIHAVPGTLWMPAAGSGIHHLGYWSDDLVTDAAELERLGYATEATGLRPDGEPYWTYQRSPTGPRIELVSRRVQAGLEQYWAAGW